jgi:aryl sulfotransferase
VSQIVWLASYPKSGNTWLRALLANFQEGKDSPVDINHLSIGGISSSRRAADDALGVECSDLTQEELARHRPSIYRNLARRSESVLFVKVHDAYTVNSDAEPLIPADVTRAVVYLVRNPLDVAVSLAHHTNKSLDDAIGRMSEEAATLAGHQDRLDFQLPQRLMSWSRHVLSWLDQSAIPVRVTRYEDMCRHPVEEFTETIRFIGLEVDTKRISRAVAFSSFEGLQEQEQAGGFKEKPYGASQFFRSGRVDGWRETLTGLQAERLIRDHATVMRRLGYLP